MLPLFYEKHKQLAIEFESKGNITVAIREWKEAMRVRPNNPEPAANLKRLQEISIQETSSRVSLNAFISQFNLAIRYWDNNQPMFALAEAKRSRETLINILTQVGMMESVGVGCADHLVKVMSKLIHEFGIEPDVNYSEALRLFDQRMLLAAEKKLLSLVKKYRNEQHGINEDLKFLAELKRRFLRLSVDSAGKQLLPCLYCRFADESDTKCRKWRDALFSLDSVTWN
jgi:hypothetical protein